MRGRLGLPFHVDLRMRGLRGARDERTCNCLKLIPSVLSSIDDESRWRTRQRRNMRLFPSSRSFLATFAFPLVQACAAPPVSQLPPDWSPEPDAASIECADPGTLIGDCREGITIEAFDQVAIRSAGWGREYRIAPGHHSLTVSFVLFSLDGTAIGHSLGFQDLEFDAAPGHKYLLCAAVRSRGWAPRIVDRSAAGI